MPSSSSEPVGVGIVGCGRAGRSLHVPALRRVPGAAVVALCDSDAAALQRLGAECPGARRYPDLEALLADQRVNLVAVCVPAFAHEAVASAAFGAGKHVFIEKPLALTLDACDRLVEAARRGEAGGVRSAVGFNLRSHRLVRRARAAIQSGELGDIELVQTLWTADWIHIDRPGWTLRRGDGGGALHEIGAHQADLWRYLVGAEVESVQAIERSDASDDQTAVVQARMSSGVLISAAVSQRTAAHNTVEVFGTRASLRFSCYHGDSFERAAVGLSGGALSRRLRPLAARAAELPDAVRAARQGGDTHLSYVNQWSAIAGALQSGGPMPAAVEDGRAAACIVLAAITSSKAGTPVSLTPRRADPAPTARG